MVTSDVGIGAPDALGRMIAGRRALVKPSHDLPLLYGDNVLEWNSRRPRTVLKAEAAWQGEVLGGKNALLFTRRWHNPCPRIKVTTFDFAAPDGPVRRSWGWRASYGITGVLNTAQIPHERYPVRPDVAPGSSSPG